MKCFLSLIYLTIFPFIAFSQISTGKQIDMGGAGWDIYTAAVYDEETGESYHFGGSASPPFTGNKTAERFGNSLVGSYDYWLCKLDKDGNKLWDKSYGGSRSETACQILLYENSLYLFGYSNSPFSGNKTAPKLDTTITHYGGDIWIVKVDLDGNKIWDKTYGGPAGSGVFDAVITSTGSFMLAGSTSTSASGDVADSNLFGFSNGWLVNLDTDGNIIWERTLQTNSGSGFWGIIEDEDGNFVTVSSTMAGVAGDKTVENISNRSDLWVVKFDPQGNVLNQNVFGSEDSESITKIYHRNNYYYLTTSTGGDATGTKDSDKIGNIDLWLLKLDKDLNLVWQKSMGGTGFTGYRGTNRMMFYGEDNIVISTSTEAGTGMGNWGQTTGYGEHDYLIFSLKDEGDFNWALQLGGSGQDYSHDFYVDSEGQIVLCGQSNSPVSGAKESTRLGAYNFNFWPVWLDTPVFTEEIEEPENLVTLYPNPAVHALHFEAGSDYKGYQIISLSGAVVNAGRVEQGQNTIDVTALPAGMYVIKLEGEGISFTKKWVKGR